jgi:FKBP-type peptidyl-prolyl cis-trans isomerase 2
MDTVNSGDRVQIRCGVAHTDAEIDAALASDVPYWIRAGAASGRAMVSPALVGMQVGERKLIVLQPEDAFGCHDPKKLHRVNSRSVPRALAVGESVSFQHEDQTLTGTVRSVDDGFTVIDANHRLAGKTFMFAVEVLAIKAAAKLA